MDATNDPVNLSDPSGRYTVGFCADSLAGLGLGFLTSGVTNHGTICLTRSQFDPTGTDSIGLTETLSNLNGHNLGLEIAAGIGLQVSNAKTPEQLRGVFTESDAVLGGLGLGASGSYFAGHAHDGKDIFGAYIGLGGGAGLGLVAQYTTTTWVQIARGRRDANLMRLAWDALAGIVPSINLSTESVIASIESASMDHYQRLHMSHKRHSRPVSTSPCES